MERRRFLRLAVLGLAGAWGGGRLAWPLTPLGALAASGKEVRLALLADAHLKNSAERRPEARGLARAVSEIRALEPKPDLVLFAGDLAHRGDPRALALGREILVDLPGPLAMVMGEGDGRPDPEGPWRRLFGDPCFSRVFADRSHPALQVLGLHTAWRHGSEGPGFSVGDAGRTWLARELARLDPGLPLIILSHAPLGRIFRPWHQWTGDAPQVLSLLSRFPRVLCLHGHVHNPADGPAGQTQNHPATLKGEAGSCYHVHQGLPATAWPRPLALQGTLVRRRPAPDLRGCGWALVSLQSSGLHFEPRLWLA